MRIYRVLGLIGAGSSVAFVVAVVVDSRGKILDEPFFLLVLIWFGLLLCNFAPVTKSDDDSLLYLWVKAKKEKLKKEIKETKEKLRKEINTD